MQRKQLLIATTNKDKLKEIQHAWADLHLDIIALSDIDPIPEPEETEETLEGNAILKARYYAQSSKLLTLADDSGLFIDALNNWPGVHSARIGNNNDERRQLVIEKMLPIQNDADRGASFKTALALYDPELQTCHVVYGEDHGIILKNIPDGEKIFCYDPIFFIPEINQTYAELSMEEKNARSHRGKALKQMQYHLSNTYSARSYVVPLSIIIHQGKILMNLRNDPHAPQFHETWEFPGGGIGESESVEEALCREAKEETGYDVRIMHRFGHIQHDASIRAGRTITLYLVPFACVIEGGESSPPKNEVIRSEWFSPDDILSQKLIGKNDMLYRAIQQELTDIIQSHPELQ